MKIDVFSHVMTPKYIEAVDRLTPYGVFAKSLVSQTPSLINMDYRFKIMDEYKEYLQVMTNAQFSRVLADPNSVELAKIANDEMAELVSKHPDRFASAIASLPLTNIDATLKEIDRAIIELKFRGIEMWTPINGKPLDRPEFFPIYEKMSHYNLPILIHPMRERQVADYSSES
jgi:predicted TIM-barrel fold metal-dependent hydrolase